MTVTINGVSYPNASVVISTNDVPVSTPTPIPAPTPAPVPAPVPLAIGCAPPTGFTCNRSPFTYEAVLGGSGNMQFDINTQFTYKFRASANQVNVHPIIFSASFYTGAQAVLSMAVTSTNLGLRDYVISTIPGSMTPVNFYGKKMNQGLADVIAISFNNQFGTCVLQKGVQYYLNVKASLPGVTVDYLLNATPL